MWVQSLGQEDPLEEDMATHSSILAWRIPGTEEPEGLQSIRSSVLTTKFVSATAGKRFVYHPLGSAGSGGRHAHRS